MYTNSRLANRELLTQVVAESTTIAETLEKMGYSASYHKQTRIAFKRRIKQFDISIDHFLNENEARCRTIKQNTIPLEDILAGKHPQYGTNLLKKRLYKASILKEECVECGQGPIWRNKLVTLHLDHKNGNPQDHRLENLRILCPMCHSQTSTYSGKNKKTKVY